jgi:uncharacterized protein (DUF1697 family)
MAKYISILRGINVGGQKRILMADLKNLYENLGFKSVVTYIQSGNVIFESDEDIASDTLCQNIEKAILEQYKFVVPIIIRSKTELENIVDANPFCGDASVDIEKLHVTFLSEVPTDAALEKIKSYDYTPDQFVIIGKHVFLHCPIDYGHSKLSNSFFESKLKVKATTRNWKTVNKLLELTDF